MLTIPPIEEYICPLPRNTLNILYAINSFDFRLFEIFTTRDTLECVKGDTYIHHGVTHFCFNLLIDTNVATRVDRYVQY
jgi:hypothetical protein